MKRALYTTKSNSTVVVNVHWVGDTPWGKRAKVSFPGGKPFFVDFNRLQLLKTRNTTRDWKDDNDIYE